MKIIQVVDVRPSLQKLAAQDLSLKTLYKVSKLLDKLEEELVFYSTQREKILEKYCEFKDGQYQPKKEDMEKLNTEIKELLEVEIDSDIKEVTIGVNEDVKLSYNDIVALKGFIRIEE